MATDGRVVHPTKSVSDPTSRSKNFNRRHLYCSTARTLNLGSTDAEVETSIIEPVHSHDTKESQRTNVERKLKGTSPELCVAGQPGDTEWSSGRLHTHASLNSSFDAHSCTDKHLGVVLKDSVSVHSAVIVNDEHHLDFQQQGKVTLIFSAF